MLIVWAVGILIVLLFGFTAFFGAPYLPTLQKSTTDALDLLNLHPGETLLELGSGDGRLLAAAAERGVYSIGYELNPLLVVFTRIKYWRYRKFISVKCANYWTQKLPKAQGMYVFLLNPYMEKLDKKIVAEASKPIKVVSNAFKIPGKKPLKVVRGMRLYLYD